MKALIFRKRVIVWRRYILVKDIISVEKKC